MTGGFQARRLAIVGLGLMGGSLAQAIRPHVERIIGIDRDERARQVALERGLVDRATADLKDGVNRADVVILATPVRVIVDLLKNELGSYLRSNTLVMDIGSTKQDIVAAMAALPIGVNAVGGHPMTGKENGGIDEADGRLYRNRPFVLCPSRRTTPAARLRAQALVESLGGLPIEMAAERHDHIVAGISHLPYLLSATLVATISNRAQADATFWALAAGGFRDTSRLAASDVTMMGDILSTNRQAVATLLAQFRMQLAMLETMLIAGDEERLSESLLPIQAARKEWARKYENGR
ncbi:MAG: prephenate dehydrogenase/arogenate dehydrogenase family protein [Chloroflexi bacterium]|nr:prephenate dehydrogenase/arogenate dehydrogenase family protein [Chloroflexota bacterium]MCY3582721.1 prephenate dehydrogenase/arogenate dehydrogenase family protein [Chloroflexota bacterium]MCY3717492.1 prephenate dehydrogenase/arogenate dehydrogenase family protein [Chloroflexota bacterium]MDE2652022.1 prephenate dehydrogenase/arogenate dehydrogenase family protein [Chloroflexota bacterium]MXV93330.1 prephenate dehydrogenase/arogenate dehydrogenase family protein [Chloroflexota bacterium]